MAGMVTDIPLHLIVRIPEIPDRPLDKDYVAALISTNEPDKWPPIIVIHQDNCYGYVTGQHRIEAARKLKLPSIQGEVRSYSSASEIYLDKWQDNIKNGKSLTTAERKAFAVNLHKIQPQLSLRELGQKSGLPHSTVKRALIEAERGSEYEEEEEDTNYQSHLQDYTKRLVSSLKKFYDEEAAFMRGKDSKRSEDRRAKALARYSSDENDTRAYDSLARSLTQAAQLIREKTKE